MKLLCLTTLFMLLVSCSHLNSVSQTSIPRNRTNLVEVKVERDIIFLFNFDNNYIDEITTLLMNKCPKGSVQGILTKDESITYFPIVYHKSIVTAKGYCVSSKRTKRVKKRRSSKKRG